jgi:hypothetical protein
MTSRTDPFCARLDNAWPLVTRDASGHASVLPSPPLEAIG